MQRKKMLRNKTMSNVIVSFARTPIGSFLGSLSSVSAPKLGSAAIKGSLGKINIDAKLVNQVILGNVLSAGIGQAPARQAAIFAGLEKSVQCLTINKMEGTQFSFWLKKQRNTSCTTKII